MMPDGWLFLAFLTGFLSGLAIGVFLRPRSDVERWPVHERPERAVSPESPGCYRPSEKELPAPPILGMKKRIR